MRKPLMLLPLKNKGVEMKKLILILAVIFMLAGCTTIVPEPPVVVVEKDIVCAGGRYQVYFGDWSYSGCPGTFQARGTYWYNENGRLFLISEEAIFDLNIATEVEDAFGKCPDGYIKEIEVK